MSKFDWTDFVVSGTRFRYNCRTRELRSPYWSVVLTDNGTRISTLDRQLVLTESLEDAVRRADLQYKCGDPAAVPVAVARDRK